MEHRRARPHQARLSPPSWCTSCAPSTAQGGFLHFGQGKWYPGEQLPRWALSICWRADGQPCWHDPALFADEREPPHYTSDDAERFIDGADAHGWASTDELHPAGLRGRLLLPVARAPAAGQRRPLRLAARRRDGARAPAPRVRAGARRGGRLRAAAAKPRADAGTGRARRWITGPWFLRDERMYLIPGDSPMGYRLPLDSLPWVTKADYPLPDRAGPVRAARRCPPAAALALRRRDAACRGAARPRRGAHAQRHAAPTPAAVAATARRRPGGPAAGDGPTCRAPPRARRPRARVGRAGSPAPRCASKCATRSAPTARRPRREHGGKSGLLYVFMPPLARLEDYLDLLAAVEATAAELRREDRAGRLPAAARPAPEDAAGDARPGRDRGQHPPGAQLGRAGRPHRVPLRRGAPRRACRPRSS